LRVGDGLALGPADVVESIGDWLCGDHVAGYHEQFVSERPQGGCPGVGRDHDSGGSQRPLCSYERRSGAALDACDLGLLEYQHSDLKRVAAHGSYERGRLNRGVRRLDHPSEVLRRPRTAGDFAWIWSAKGAWRQSFGAADHFVPCAELRSGGGGPQPAATAKLGFRRVF
jgi:hypothetical protein